MNEREVDLIKEAIDLTISQISAGLPQLNDPKQKETLRALIKEYLEISNSLKAKK